MKKIVLATALALALAGTAQAEDVKIGLITTLSGPLGAQGKNVRDGFQLALEEAGGKLGGLDVKLFIEDDEVRPDVGLQAAHKLIEQDKVQILTGVVFSNVALAIAKPAADNEVFFITTGAGPSQLAGKNCSPYFFASGWQNDQPHEAMGAYLQETGTKSVYLIAPNYAAGKDALRGFKHAYKGEVVGETYVALNQLDYAAEISKIRASKPDALFAFLPAGMGINFTKQYAQAGLVEEIPMYSAFTVDSTTMPAIGEAAVNTFQSNSWNTDFPNEANKQFVEKFEKKYGYVPAVFAALSYDVAHMIDSALREAGGIKDKAAFETALKNVKFDSVVGSFKFNSNNFPIGNFYLLEVIKHQDGKIKQVTKRKILEDAKDAYYQECKMG